MKDFDWAAYYKQPGARDRMRRQAADDKALRCGDYDSLSGPAKMEVRH